jgi:haloacetate dehalogenase
MIDDFESHKIGTGDTGIFVRTAGSGPPVLLLHGFPETHLMWREVAPLLARDYTVVCADLRGYGDSGAPASTPDRATYSKRTLAQDMVYVMQHLGFERFAVAGHDRGGRVAYRMALDHPERIERLAVLDIVPTDAAWQHADDAFSLGFWPWSLLAQPEPFPERLLLAAPDAFIANAINSWGTSPDAFPPAVRDAYVAALRDPAHAHAICEEYRAAATIDREHDAADIEAGNCIKAPLLALWSANGPLGNWYQAEGGPLALWREYADDVEGRPVEGGHFFPEERPEETAAALASFFDGDEG